MQKKCIQGISVFFFALLLLFQAGQGFSADATSFVPNNVSAEAPAAGGVPVGTVIAWASSSLPSLEGGVQKWAECNGQTLSQAAYPELFAAKQAQEVA